MELSNSNLQYRHSHVFLDYHIFWVVLVSLASIWFEYSQYAFKAAHNNLCFLTGCVINISNANIVVVEFFAFSNCSAPPLFCLKKGHFIK